MPHDLPNRVLRPFTAPVEPSANRILAYAPARARRRRFLLAIGIVVAVGIAVVGGERVAAGGPIEPADSIDVDAMIASTQERIATLRKQQTRQIKDLRNELRQSGDRKRAVRLTVQIAATRQSIDKLGVELWFDLRDALSVEQLDAVEKEFHFRDLNFALLAVKTSKNLSIPLRLTRSDISAGIAKIRGRISECGERLDYSGRVYVKMMIGPSGRVTKADATGAIEPLRKCVSRVTRRARFRRTQKGMSVNYPFVFRSATHQR